MLSILAVLFGASILLYATTPVSVDVVPFAAVLIFSALIGWTQQIDMQSLAAFRSTMALEDQDKFIQIIIDNTFDGIFLFSANGNIEFLNTSAIELFGYEAEEINGKNIGYLIGSKRTENEKNIHQINPLEFKPGLTETMGINRDGLTFPIDLSISKIENPVSNHVLERRKAPRISYLCAVRDISERKLREADFNDRHSIMTDTNRMISISEMAAGLAHEINQTLTAIFGYLEGVLRRLSNISIVPENIIEAIEKALIQAERTREIIRRTRSVTQKIELNRSPIDVNKIVEESIDLLKFDISRFATAISLELAPDLPPIQADAVQIQQVIINLARNGMEAMSELNSLSRYLIIETHLDDTGFVKICVKDNGPGFDKDIADKIFFPFATTKNEGMGIGLSICSTIIQDHDGMISVDKNQSGPTTFTVKLPIIEGFNSGMINGNNEGNNQDNDLKDRIDLQLQNKSNGKT